VLPRRRGAFGAVRQSFARVVAWRSVPIPDTRSAAAPAIQIGIEIRPDIVPRRERAIPRENARKISLHNSVTLRCKFDNPRNQLIDCLGSRSGSRSNSSKSERCRAETPSCHTIGLSVELGAMNSPALRASEAVVPFGAKTVRAVRWARACITALLPADMGAFRRSFLDYCPGHAAI
jgi:hypothetical protein